MESSILAGIIVGFIMGGAATVMTILAVALIVLSVVAKWQVFTKAGIAGWKSLIPFYNTYLTYQLSGLNPWLCIPILLAGCTSSLKLENYEGTTQTIISVVIIAVGLTAMVMEFKRATGTAKAFGKGTGFAWGLFFLEPIFEMILGFGEAKYQAPALAAADQQTSTEKTQEA
ncbi:hypothetical protein IJJ08_02930 [bacterium]|nr:hypothetical protein [bacterium]